MQGASMGLVCRCGMTMGWRRARSGKTDRPRSSGQEYQSDDYVRNKKCFALEDTYIRTEYDIAENVKKKRYIVWLEKVSIDNVHEDLTAWFVKFVMT